MNTDRYGFGFLVLLLALIAIAAIPYGTVEPWWKAAFVCAVFAICVLAIVESLIRGSLKFENGSILLPMLALSVLAFVQSVSLGSREVAGLLTWTTISADPYQTRFFALQMLALTVFLALLYRYASTERHMRALVYTILTVALVSALFGILRQSMQQQTGFILPLLKQNQGYGQFINKNHFAYLMEMAFGLGLGVLIGRFKRDRIMIEIAFLLPIWVALVLSNSRGGMLAMLTQIVVAALLLLSLRTLSRGVPQIALTPVLRIVLVGMLMAGVLVGTFWVGRDRLAENLQITANEFDPSGSPTRNGVSRNEIWRATLKMFAAHPVVGVGLGGYWIAITAYHDASGLMTPQEAHNDYLELLSSGGVIGLAIGVWFIIAVVRKARANLLSATGFALASRLGAILGIVGVAAHSLVDFGLHIMVNAVVFLALISLATGPVSHDLRDLHD